MRIDNSNLSGISGAAGADKAAERRRTAEALQTGQADVSDLSALATKLASSDEDRIERLRKAVESGSYNVDPAAIASRLIDDSLKLSRD